jgi:tetratricopeptide (TPR) repeat protein
MLSVTELRARGQTTLLGRVLFSTALILSQAYLFAQSPSKRPPADTVLEGKVCSATGDPLAGVLVRLRKDSESASPITARTDTAGIYRFSALAEGSYLLVLERDGFRPVTLPPVQLKLGEQKHLDAVLEPTLPPNPTTTRGADAMELSDTPNFTVAGVTDWSNVGLHGSDANVRTSEALAKEAASLKSNAPEKNNKASRAGVAHRTLGDAKEAAGDPMAAVMEYEAAVKDDPSEENYFAWGAELLLHRAGQAAVQVLSAGAKAHPDSSRMLAGLGAAYYANGQHNEAASKICRASDLDPQDAAPYLLLGKMEQAEADPLHCSEAAFSRFVAQQPENPQANYFYGLVLWKNARKTQNTSNFTRAEQLFRRAVTLNPRFAEVYLQLGLLYNARGERGSALDAFQKAASTNPKFSQAHYQLSLAYRRSGDVARANLEMETYDQLRRSEDAAAEKERRELRQFVTILQEGKHAQP